MILITYGYKVRKGARCSLFWGVGNSKTYILKEDIYIEADIGKRVETETFQQLVWKDDLGYHFTDISNTTFLEPVV